ncbi:hypothetical protein [Amycolatopsis sp. lyj-109]|uniref:hypothetical protein n=1 Tax=Amycolatopsis sp. lyj-109 TaxID=2789287 RepID=UPI00397B81CE
MFAASVSIVVVTFRLRSVVAGVDLGWIRTLSGNSVLEPWLSIPTVLGKIGGVVVPGSAVATCRLAGFTRRGGCGGFDVAHGEHSPGREDPAAAVGFRGAGGGLGRCRRADRPGAVRSSSWMAFPAAISCRPPPVSATAARDPLPRSTMAQLVAASLRFLAVGRLLARTGTGRPWHPGPHVTIVGRVLGRRR